MDTELENEELEEQIGQPKEFKMPKCEVGDSVWFFPDPNKRLVEAPRDARVVAVGNNAVDLAVWSGASYVARNGVRNFRDPILKKSEHQRANGCWRNRKPLFQPKRLETVSLSDLV